VLAKMRGCEVPCTRIGTTGGAAVSIVGEGSLAIDDLKTRFEGWLPAYMSGGAA
jgi:phosphoribosylformylglycinamidine synthase subunit PurL